MPPPPSTAAQVDSLALGRHRRMHAHLDWWTVDEWRDSDARVTAAEGRGALIVIPVDSDDPLRLGASASATAWLRWCVVADGAPATRVLRELFGEAEARLRAVGIRELFAAVAPHSWLAPYLADQGFHGCDSVITFARPCAPVPLQDLGSQPTRIADAHAADLAAVSAVDHAAFEPCWWYSADVLSRALRAMDRFRVAWLDGNCAGYAFQSISDGNAHLTRIAVRPADQRRGIGSGLLADALAEAAARGAATMTLNTQASNRASQRLYGQFGFKRVGDDLTILRKRL